MRCKEQLIEANWVKSRSSIILKIKKMTNLTQPTNIFENLELPSLHTFHTIIDIQQSAYT